MIYVPYWQDTTPTDARLCIRVAGSPAAVLATIKRVIAGIDAQVPGWQH
jgi:hypothetical protein